MFNLFNRKRKTEREKLLKQYEKLMAASHRLSTVNSQASDQKNAEAHEIAARVDTMEQ